MYIITSTTGNLERLKYLLNSLKNQSLKDFFVYIILDKYVTKTEKQEIEYFIQKYITNFKLITNLYSNFYPQNNVSYNRNRIFKNKKLNKYNFCFWVDDDNQFDKNFLKDLQKNRKYIYQQIKKNFILSPKIVYRKSNIYQSL
jgi:hypothetical protein